MKTLYLFLVLMSASLTLVFGQSDVEYKSTLKKMFEVSGSDEAYKSGIRQMFVMFRQKENVPGEVWDVLESEFLQTSLNDLVDMLTPVYQKHLTIGDLQKVIQFYQTPAGEKFAQKTPFIMQESMHVGQQWGMKIGKDVEAKLKERGY
ncbi:MAG TPA: DUF2059 domain-containing protein [Chryseosolibacter sp.]|nr:DUF2059 domain-containing protein [Chryseosolibacter sp.]